MDRKKAADVSIRRTSAQLGCGEQLLILSVQNCKPAASGSRLRKSRYCCRTKTGVVSIGLGAGEPPAFMVMCGAVLVSRLEAEPTVMTIGKSPVLTVDGKTKSTVSVPGRSEVAFTLAIICVVPTITLIVVAALLRTPVKDTRKTVATWFPVPSLVVTVNGSGEQ